MTNAASIVIDQEFVDWMQANLLARASFADRTDPINESKLLPAIKKFYSARELKMPKVVICQSPLQMRLMPVLFLCPKLDQMFVLTDGTVSDQVRKKLITLIGSEITQNLYTRFGKNYKPGDEPGEFLVGKFNVVHQLNAGRSERASDTFDPETKMEIMNRYFQLRNGVTRYWVLFDHIQNYIRQLPMDVVVPMEAGLQEKIVLQISMNLKASLNALIRHLTLAQIHTQASSGISELEQVFLDIVNQRLDRDPPLLMPNEPIWNALAEAHLIYPFENICFVCEFPLKVVRSDGFLHCEDQAAVEYSDGLKFHFWRGVRVPADIIEQRDSVTVSRIQGERNIEVRRVMIDMIGAEKYIQESGAVPIQQDEFGSLFELGTVPGDRIVMVRVVNSTEESDGTRRVYWLRVPPITRTAKEGVAWTFNMAEAEYQPIKES